MNTQTNNTRKNLGEFIRPNGKIVYRQFLSDNANPKETLIWVATEFAPDNETNHVRIIERENGFEIIYPTTNEVETYLDFADVFNFVRENGHLNTEQLTDALFNQFDFCDM